MRPTIVVPIMALLTATACASGVDSAIFMAAPPLPPDQEVRIYRTQSPSCPYDELGLVTWSPTSSFQKLQSGVDGMRSRAREMGGHAIIGFSLGDLATGTTTTIVSDSSKVSVGSKVDTRLVVSGTVVRFREGSCP